MSKSAFGSSNAGNKSKFSSVNLNKTTKPPDAKKSLLGALKNAGPGNLSGARRTAAVPAPKSLILKSLKAENGGLDPSVALVSGGTGGWKTDTAEATKDTTAGAEVSGDAIASPAPAATAGKVNESEFPELGKEASNPKPAFRMASWADQCWRTTNYFKFSNLIFFHKLLLLILCHDFELMF